ncbi:pyridoxine/pyridoxamine 5'-phosphate oxidase [Aldersonia kunmingensis]|uniref:pyridoxine/pyridoxamine 5'-phosphate oxidase n=1 Tax=Aldersonia kunmingensis TaxID=408066 RepID=UPI00082DD2D8|nr:pyridoxal 5'-phosphate synthase [Aldersonia kunmingensis]
MPRRTEFSDNRAWLRSLGFAAIEPPYRELPDPAVPPHDSFLRWLEDAVDAGIPEPHVGVLATTGADGLPSARVLMLRDIDASGWSVSGPDFSVKGAHIAANPQAALTFYWREHGRQVRIAGSVIDGGIEAASRDFHDRSTIAQAVAFGSKQSAELADESEYFAAVADAQNLIEHQPQLLSAHWRVWRIEPMTVEFWQADPGRRHLRRRFTRAEPGWSASDLWP